MVVIKKVTSGRRARELAFGVERKNFPKYTFYFLIHMGEANVLYKERTEGGKKQKDRVNQKRDCDEVKERTSLKE